MEAGADAHPTARHTSAPAASDARTDDPRALRDALGPPPAAPDIPRAYRLAGALPRDGVVDLFCERVSEYRATVHRVTDVAAAVREILAGAERIGVPAALADLGTVVDDNLSVAELDSLDAIVTGCALAIAETGTIVLDSGPVSGRRALTLVPDHHVCIVRADDIVPSVPTPSPRSTHPARSRSSPARPPRPTSSSTASRASTARERST